MKEIDNYPQDPDECWKQYANVSIHPVDREQYQRNLAERQRKHREQIQNTNWKPCMHDMCQQCHGTGIKVDGSMCIHMISCRCPKCAVVCSG